VQALNADFNSVVKKGQVIAQIDPTIWLTQLQDAQASLQRAQATLQNARSDYNRYKELYKHQLVSSSDLEAKQMAFDTANAGVASARSTVAKAKINLGYCTITAPVDGVVVSRLVDVGQTVAASFSTPNLFTIPGPFQDEGPGGHRRGGHRSGAGGPGGLFHRGQLPRPAVQGEGERSPAEPRHHPERGHLQRGHGSHQRAPLRRSRRRGRPQGRLGAPGRRPSGRRPPRWRPGPGRPPPGGASGGHPSGRLPRPPR
jgi:hypothetical protein